MGTAIKDFESRQKIRQALTATGTIGPFNRRGEGYYRVVVENADAGNVIQCQGRLEGQTDWQDVGLPVEGEVLDGVTIDVKDYDEIQFVCSTYEALDASGIRFIASGFFFEGAGSGGGGAVDSVNGQTGTVVLTKSNIGLGNVNNTSDANKPVSTAQAAADAAVQAYAIQRANHTGVQTPDTIETGTLSVGARFDDAGLLTPFDQVAISEEGYHTFGMVAEADDQTGNFEIFRYNLNLVPLQDSPDESWQMHDNQVSFDPNTNGFSLGTNGTAFRFHTNNFVHNSTADLGYVEFIQNNFGIGNGTDPFDFRGFGYIFGFGTIADGVNLVGPLQGYGFQISVADGATFDTGSYVNAFYDNANIACSVKSYNSFNAGPNIAAVQSNNNYMGFSAQANIDEFEPNSGFTGVNVSPTLGIFGLNAYFNGVNVNPTIDEARNAYGINVSMDNVTPYAGLQSSIVIQDLTITFTDPGDNDGYQIEYIDDGTAGAETVSIAGQLITVHMEDGVSTATQIKAAMEANVQFNAAVDIVISGVGSNPQSAAAAANFSGGENPGQIRAAYFDGDVEITGSLTFGGALSIGALNAFGTIALADNGGQPASVHTLINQLTCPDNSTIANADTLGVNTAALINLGDNSVITTGFLGVTALGLPAVASLGANTTVDRIGGAAFALSLDAGAGAGSEIDIVSLCRSLAIPNGITQVNRLYGYEFSLPFGDPGTDTWGFYEAPGVNNYLAGNLLIGGTAGSDDIVTNDSVALEIKSTTKAFVSSRMNSTERDALTAIAGMVIFNTTTNKHQGYDGSAWQDFY